MSGSENETNDRQTHVNSPPIFDGRLDFRYINTNARSLRPKITSVIDSFENLELLFAIITETWFTEGEKLQKESEDLLLGHALGSITLSRKPGNAGYSHGGVCIIYKDSEMTAKKVAFPNPENFEVLISKCNVRGLKRKLFIIAAYIPPGYTVARGKSCLEHIRNAVLQIKNDNKDPLIGVFGDFNQWKIDEALLDYQDMIENVGGFTRKDRIIDRNFCNWSEAIKSTTIMPPLQTEITEAGSLRRSDHNVVFTQASLDRAPDVGWTSFYTRPYTAVGAEGFKEWIKGVDWSHVFMANGSNAKAREFQATLDEGVDLFFPMKLIKKKDSDLPWIDDIARRRIKKKKGHF